MLAYIDLKNFKSLTDTRIDFRGENRKPKKIVFIYGENGSGKTNIISSILFLEKTLLTLTNTIKLKEFSGEKNFHESLPDFENDVEKNYFIDFLKENLYSLENLIRDNKTIDCEEDMEIKIGFNINGIEGSYELKFDNNSVIFEELKYLVNERVGSIFKIDKGNITISPSMILSTSYRKELIDNIEKYWGKNTFMSIIFNEFRIKNDSFTKKTLSRNFLNVFSWLSKISLQCKNGKSIIGRIATSKEILSKIEKGNVDNERNKELLSMENFLNGVFTQLYSDIKRVFYVFKHIDNKFEYELYFTKLIDGELKDIPFTLESTGTQRLIETIKYIFLYVKGNTVLVDELENGIHDLLIYEVISSLLNSFGYSENSQFIATTHSTYLMEMLPQEYVYIIVGDAFGKKNILSIDKYEFRTQKNNNVRLKYLRGDYSGIPNVGYLDFNDLVDQFEEDLN
ncbi:AAA family ATPase [Mogibacterium neglectum]|uniref:AAA family ATPase n=1 Tax=Mogibacterium neglectum TaxID=114528 RepID=UPI00272BB097|nr:AAA family ATPase [Mogibacterium neglectum]WLD75810.1 AAA family ATPase [Mogibacterium neglectum]